MTIGELNDIVRSKEKDEFIRVCEAKQRKALSKIADTITESKGVRLVLLAGGSSAGKTTTAKRLCTQLRVNGFHAINMSTDDFFVGDARNPRDENGELDYESIECVDREVLCSRLDGLFAGRKINPRRFDFMKHEGYDAHEEISIPPGNGIVVIEGLHALNPALLEKLSSDVGCFRMFIEPKSTLDIFGPTKLRSTDARLIRRFVRDCQFRKMSVEDTLKIWPKVLAGEEKWINPFRGSSNAEFDSALEYELAVLKPYAAGLLERARIKNPADRTIARLLALFEFINPTDSMSVPGDSILRETIGGSQLEY